MNARALGWAALVAAVVLHAGPAAAQVPGAALRPGDLEAGIMWKRIDRQVSSESTDKEFKQDNYSVVVRYGITRVATASVELSGDQNWLGFSDDYAVYVFGVGMQATLWEYQSWSITASVHYQRMFAMHHDPAYCNVDEVEIDALVSGWYTFHTRFGDVQPWLAPAVSYFSATPQPPCAQIEFSSNQELGGAFGVEWRQGHSVIGAHAFWVDEFQPRLVVAWRF